MTGQKANTLVLGFNKALFKNYTDLNSQLGYFHHITDQDFLALKSHIFIHYMVNKSQFGKLNM